MAPNWQIPHPQFSVLLGFSATAAALLLLFNKRKDRRQKHKSGDECV